jgi:hypothetical protein
MFHYNYFKKYVNSNTTFHVFFLLCISGFIGFFYFCVPSRAQHALQKPLAGSVEDTNSQDTNSQDTNPQDKSVSNSKTEDNIFDLLLNDFPNVKSHEGSAEKSNKQNNNNEIFSGKIGNDTKIYGDPADISNRNSRLNNSYDPSESGPGYYLFESNSLNTVISSRVPDDKKGNWKYLLPENREEYYYLSPLETSNAPSNRFKSKLNEIIMSRRIAIDIEEAVSEGADILNEEETKIGQRASNDELGIYMLVPIGWRKDNKSTAVFRYYSLSIFETEAYIKLTPPEKQMKFINAQIDEQQYIELFIEYLADKNMETREIAMFYSKKLISLQFKDAIIDFDTDYPHNDWAGWKSVIIGFKKSGLNMICYSAVFRPGVIDETKREKIIIFNFVFLESNQVKYHVLFDAMIKSIYWAEAVKE